MKTVEIYNAQTNNNKYLTLPFLKIKGFCESKSRLVLNENRDVSFLNYILRNNDYRPPKLKTTTQREEFLLAEWYPLYSTSKFNYTDLLNLKKMKTVVKFYCVLHVNKLSIRYTES